MGISIQKVVKRYDRVQVLHGVSMELTDGSVHGLIGENGSGKTTLIKCIMGIYKPDSGSITYNGKEIYENPGVKEHIGYVADNNRYFPSYPLGRMAAFFSKLYPQFDMERLHQLNSIFGLDMNKRVGTLSKGQKMRLAFMLNIAAKTDVLIMDEPTSGLDAVARKQLFDILIEEVEKRNLTVLISSHNLLELERVCDSMTIIKNGRVSEDKDMDEVLKTVRKFNLVFPDGAPENFLREPKLVNYSNIGNIYTVVMDSVSDEELEDIKKQYAPAYVEELNVNLEEVFVFTNGGGNNGR